MIGSSILRIGLLGVSRVATTAIVNPASLRADVAMIGVASRNSGRATRFAEIQGSMRSMLGYEALINAPDIDLIYISTHAPSHAMLALQAIAAGKHVLVEKPFAIRLEDAQAIANAAEGVGVFVGEAMHSLFHMAWRRLLAAVASGAIGRVRHIEAVYEEFTPDVPGEHRWRAEDGGGAMLDIGIYLIAFARAIVGTEPTGVRAAEARWHKGVDAASRATLDFPGGVSADIRCALDVTPTVSLLRITGTAGQITLDNPIVPHRGYQLVIDGTTGRQIYSGTGETSYAAQLDAVVATVLRGESFPLPHHDFVGSVRALSLIRKALGC